MSLKPTTGTISASSPRAREWAKVLGTGTVELESPIASKGRALRDGVEVVAEFYKVKISALTPDQIERIVGHLSEKFGDNPDEIRAALRDPAHGLPLLAEDITVTLRCAAVDRMMYCINADGTVQARPLDPLDGTAVVQIETKNGERTFRRFNVGAVAVGVGRDRDGLPIAVGRGRHLDDRLS